MEVFLMPYPALVEEVREMQAPESEGPQVSVHATRVKINPEDGIPNTLKRANCSIVQPD
jgi:hypothetical protein